MFKKARFVLNLLQNYKKIGENLQLFREILYFCIKIESHQLVSVFPDIQANNVLLGASSILEWYLQAHVRKHVRNDHF